MPSFIFLSYKEVRVLDSSIERYKTIEVVPYLIALCNGVLIYIS